MRQFIKFFTASCLGTITAIALILLIIVIYGIFQDSSSEIKQGSILQLTLKSQVPEKSNNVKPTGGIQFNAEEYLGLHRIAELIQHASSDNNISGIILDGNISGIAPASLEIIREALKDFKHSEKFLFSYADYYSQSGYYLASLSDSIFLNPNGNIDIRGYGVMIPFYKEAMDKLGIKMNVFYAGDFKSASEPYRRNSMSPENKTQTRSYLESIAQSYNYQVAQSRNIPVESMEKIADDYAIRTSADALANHLVDSIVYKTEVDVLLRKKLDSDSPEYISIEKYSANTFIEKNSDSKNKIAIIIAEGDILYRDSSKGIISEKRYSDIIDKIKKDDAYKAAVLRVNSPGGDGFTSDVIWHKIEELKAANIPVIASYGDYAASGGYYISCGADKIVSQANTLTGSIGVFSMLPDATDLLEDKIGIQFDSVKTAPYALGISPFLKLSSGDKKLIEAQTDRVYELFLERVAAGRSMTKEEVHAIAQGRVWTGSQALENGLVDEIGDLDRALELASEIAEIESYNIVEYPFIEENPYQKLMQSLLSDQVRVDNYSEISIGSSIQQKIQLLTSMMKQSGPIMRLPFIVDL